MTLTLWRKPSFCRRVTQNRMVFVALVSALAICSVTRAKAFAPSVVRAPLSSFPRMSSETSVSSTRFMPSSALQTRGGAQSTRSHRKAKSSSGRGAAKVVFDGTPMLLSTAIFAAMNTLGFVLSMETKSQLHLDLLGTGAFAAAALPPLLNKSENIPRINRSSRAVILWGVKLAGFLLFRVIQKGHDTRLTEMLSTVGGTATFWFVSFLWGVICSLPHTIGTTSSLEGNSTSLAIGGAMYVVGILFESLADYQKWVFKAANPGKFCNVGLWSISQHPNFFGNLLLWAGIFVMNASALVEPVPPGASLWKKVLSYRRVFFAFLGPWFMWNFFHGQADGSLSNTVELATAKYGSDPNYNEYVKNVPLIVPKNPFSK